MRRRRCAPGRGDPGDLLPGLIAGQICWIHQTVVADAIRAKCHREVLAFLDDIEELLSEKVLNYAVRDRA